MKSIVRRLSIALALTPSLCSAGAAAQPAEAPTRTPAPPPAEAGEARPSSLDAYLGAIVAQQGGLTSVEVAKRARATSFDARARHAEVEAAAAAVDQAFLAFLPKLTVALRYTRLSPLDDQVLGQVVVAPTADGDGPIPRDAPLVSATIAIPSIVDQSALQGTLVVPLSDYVLRLTQGYAAASRSHSAARLNEEAGRRKAALDGQLAYYGWAPPRRPM
jgi:outer membrane protein